MRTSGLEGQMAQLPIPSICIGKIEGNLKEGTYFAHKNCWENFENTYTQNSSAGESEFP